MTPPAAIGSCWGAGDSADTLNVRQYIADYAVRQRKYERKPAQSFPLKVLESEQKLVNKKLFTSFLVSKLLRRNGLKFNKLFVHLERVGEQGRKNDENRRPRCSFRHRVQR